MSYVVVLLDTDHRSVVDNGSNVHVFGPYSTLVGAETARRRIHFDAMRETDSYRVALDRVPRTYVKPIEQEPR